MLVVLAFLVCTVMFIAFQVQQAEVGFAPNKEVNLGKIIGCRDFLVNIHTVYFLLLLLFRNYLSVPSCVAVFTIAEVSVRSGFF